MKTSLLALVSALLLTGCSSMNDRDNASGSSGATTTTGQTGATSNLDPTGIGASSTGQPYGVDRNQNTGTTTDGNSGSSNR